MSVGCEKLVLSLQYAACLLSYENNFIAIISVNLQLNERVAIKITPH